MEQKKALVENVETLLNQCEEVSGEPMVVKKTSKHRLAGQVVRYVQDSADGMVIAYFQNGMVKDIPKADLEPYKA